MGSTICGIKRYRIILPCLVPAHDSQDVLTLLHTIANQMAEGVAAEYCGHFPLFLRILMEFCRVAAGANNEVHHCQWVSGGTACNQACHNVNNLIHHLRDAHDAQGPSTRTLFCHWLTESGVCGKRLRRHAFRRHILRHLGHRVACPRCGRLFSRVDSMRTHARKVHRQQ